MDRKGYQREKKVVVKRGVDIKGQVVGSDKGSYFTGSLKEYDTYVVKQLSEPFWRITFRDATTGEVFQSRFRSRIFIGRMPINGEESVFAVPGDPMISKKHCSIFEAANQLFVEDLNSKNGTFVNDKRIDGTQALNNGDMLRIGQTKFIVGYGRG